MKKIDKRLQEGEVVRLALKGEVVSANENGFTFLYRSRQDKRFIRTQTFHIEGFWYLTRSSQLRFRTKYFGKILRFEGIWKINKATELIYLHERRKLKRGVIAFRQIHLRGFWQLSPHLRLRYSLEAGQDALEFRGKLSRLVSSQGRGKIYYELSGGYQKYLTHKDTGLLIIHGMWRPLSKAEIGFEIRISPKKSYFLRFRGSFRLTSKGRIEFSLSKSSTYRIPKVSLVFSRQIFNDKGEIFLKGGRSILGCTERLLYFSGSTIALTEKGRL